MIDAANIAADLKIELFAVHAGGGFVALGVQHRRTRLCRFEEIEYRRQFPVFDVDQLQGSFSDVARFGGNQRDDFSHMAHAIDRHHWLIVDDRPKIRIESVEIVARDNRRDTGKVERFAGVDANEIGVGVGTAQRFGMKHARHRQIGSVVTRARHFRQPADHGYTLPMRLTFASP